jgi:hypothetical protein
MNLLMLTVRANGFAPRLDLYGRCYPLAWRPIRSHQIIPPRLRFYRWRNNFFLYLAYPAA